MTWRDGFALMRLMSEEMIGAPGRRAKVENEEQEIERLRAGLRGAEI